MDCWNLSSNHKSEMIGLLAALELARDFVWPDIACPKKIYVFTDNQGVIFRLRNPRSPRPGQYIFLRILSIIKQVYNLGELHLVWCPGHEGIKWNEMVDRLAGDAVADPTAPLFQTKGNLRKVVRSIVGPPTKPESFPKINRFSFSLIVQLGSGHCAINSYLYRMRKITDPLCPFCRRKETVEHIFNHCERYKKPCQDLRRQLRSLNIGFNPNRLNLLLRNMKTYECIATFLEDTKRF